MMSPTATPFEQGDHRIKIASLAYSSLTFLIVSWFIAKLMDHMWGS